MSRYSSRIGCNWLAHGVLSVKLKCKAHEKQLIPGIDYTAHSTQHTTSSDKLLGAGSVVVFCVGERFKYTSDKFFHSNVWETRIERINFFIVERWIEPSGRWKRVYHLRFYGFHGFHGPVVRSSQCTHEVLTTALSPQLPFDSFVCAAWFRWMSF